MPPRAATGCIALSLKGVEPKDVDFVVIRENTEGSYTDAGGVFKRGTPR